MHNECWVGAAFDHRALCSITDQLATCTWVYALRQDTALYCYWHLLGG